METALTLGYTTPQHGDTDTASIQNAIFSACELGLNKTVIPRYNQQTESMQWHITEPVHIPSNFVLCIDNAVICFEKNGSFVIGDDQTLTQNTQIIGNGNASLFGNHAHGAEPLLQILWASHITIEGISFFHTCSRSVFLQGVQNASIKNLYFDCDIPFQTQKDHPSFQNISAVTVSNGCCNIVIENISGTTMGNTVELLATAEALLPVEPAICDIVIRNIKSDCMIFSNVAITNTQGAAIARITIDTVTDTSEIGSCYRARSTVSIGDCPFGTMPAPLGNTRNITAKNIVSRGACAVELVHSVMDITIADLTLLTDGGSAIGCPKSLEYNNIYLCNVKMEPQNTEPYLFSEVTQKKYIRTPVFPGENFYPYRAVCNMKDTFGHAFRINGIYADRVDNLLRILGKNTIDLYDVDILEITYDDIVDDNCVIEQ